MSAISYNFGISALSRLILGGISLVVVGFLTRCLGPAGFGQYSLIFAYLVIFTTLADLGLYTIMVREISKPGANEKYVVSNIFSIRLVGLFICLVLGILLVGFLSYSGEIKIGVTIALLFAFFSSLGQVLTGIFQKYLALYLVSLADVIARACQLILIIFLVRLNAGLLAFVWIAAISEIVHFLLIFLFSRKFVKFSLRYDPAYWSKTIKNALPIAVSMVFVLLYFKMDTVILSLMKPSYDVGVYSVAYKILEVVIFLPAVYVGLIMPILSKHGAGDKNVFLREFQWGFNVLAIFAVPTMAVLMFRAGDIIRIIGGSEFFQSVPVLQILSIAIALIFFGNIAGSALVALDLQKKGMKVYFWGAVINVAANIILIPRYSFFATAWTTVFTELFITAGILLLIKKQTGISVKYSSLYKAAVAAIITIAVVFPWRFSFFPALGASLIYFPILYLLRGFTMNDMREMIVFKRGV